MKIPDPAFLVGIMLAIGFIPFFAILATSFTKLIVVFGILRLALGLQQVPPNMVMNAVAILLTCFIMAPTADAIYENLTKQKFDGAEFGQRFEDFITLAKSANEPIKSFLGKHTREREKKLFLKAAGDLWPKQYYEKTQSDDLLILVPSFTLSELTQAFQIGFILYIAFTVVDLVVAAGLLALGMSMVSPLTISIPFKLILFVSLDGWSYLIKGLLLTY